ncbi:molecular chaperone DnaJ [Thiorhodococcus mannitoliphagus]|uniref:Molecular chaperone DnaJ n=1 Tax=Thiorhodococcus mannitoliphagus TaxID=329406 RepID=A0A6P1DSK9_9GAMM|nr:energy-coupling factor ABC transporter permease [Thiorhodococcus mannitoliphagus]NEX21277.1 molecular chaperone DnaJ [Thiorhodococcus mannitoliphagus]
MTIDAGLLSPLLLWVLIALFALSFLLALRLAPWRKLKEPEQANVFFGASVALLLLWHLETQVQPGLSYHLLGVTAVTLMFGWSLAVVSATLALAGVTLNTGGAWKDFAVNAFLAGVVPITLTQFALILIRWYLPKQFFVYVLINGFVTAGLVAACAAYLAIALLVMSGAYSFAEMGEKVIPFFPLMFMPEAFLNGWAMVVLVAFKPGWVYSFSDEQYLKGK